MSGCQIVLILNGVQNMDFLSGLTFQSGVQMASEYLTGNVWNLDEQVQILNGPTSQLTVAIQNRGTNKC